MEKRAVDLFENSMSPLGNGTLFAVNCDDEIASSVFSLRTCDEKYNAIVTLQRIVTLRGNVLKEILQTLETAKRKLENYSELRN